MHGVDNIFGTDGIRARIGKGLLTNNNLHILGKALAEWGQQKYHKNKLSILIIYDTRNSCMWIKSCLESGLLLYPITLYDGHILPTPAALTLIHHAANHQKFDYALVISASHNPYYDNGIKIIDTHGKLTHKDELIISELFHQLSSANETCSTTWGTTVSFDQGKAIYCAQVASLFPPLFLKNKKIVLDCAHGATYQTAPIIFSLLGAEVIPLHNNPNGTNINANCGTEHVDMLQKTVLELQAYAGFAFDGDGDRVIAVSNNGSIKNGDDIIALLLEHPAYATTKTVIGTSMTNSAFEHYLHTTNRNLIRTEVGDKHVIAQLQEKNLPLGGEQAGHIIIKDICPTSDGTIVALKVLETIILNNNNTMKTFEHYPYYCQTISIKHKPSLSQKPFAELIETYQKKLTNGRIIVRYSGTEPILRIMVEAQTQQVSKQYAQALALELCSMLETLPLKEPLCL